MSVTVNGHIVVGIDDTLRSQAIRWGAEQARLEQRGLLLVNATGPVSPGWTVRPVVPPTRSWESLKRHGERLLARAAEEARRAAPGVDVETRVELVDPRTLLIELSADAHLLVLGSRGRGPVASHLLGSVGVSVVRHSACPVVVHRPDHANHPRIGIVVAADAGPDSAPVLDFAFRQASLRHLSLRVLHFSYDVPPVPAGPAMSSETLSAFRADAEADARALAESLAGYREQYPDVRVSLSRRYGAAEKELAVDSSRADLLVVGSHQRNLMGLLLLGSTSLVTLERATCPVAVVPVRS
jgi:nucleotide-binding universal stress UspA family protein